MTETAVKLSAGFSVADADQPCLSLDDNELVVAFREWTEDEIELRFLECYAVRWQAVITRRNNLACDEVYEVRNSAWLALHRSEGAIEVGEPQRHFRLNFNAWGQLDVLAGRMELAQRKSASVP